MPFSDYQKLVSCDYQRKRDKNVLSLSLVQPSPAKLKEECLRVCGTRYDEKDARGLRDFFGDIKDKDDCLRKIKKKEIAEFRPLEYYLKGKTARPDTSIIELLAWLIDFELRPFDIGENYNEEGIVEVKEVVDGKVKENNLLSELEKVTEFFNVEKPEPEKIDDRKEESEEEKGSIFKQVSSNESIDGDVPNGMSKKGYKKKRYVIISIAFLIIACVLGYALRKSDGQNIITPLGSSAPSLPHKYMYWAGEEYKELNNDEKVKGIIVVLYDSTRFFNFRKIMDPSTITPSDIKNVWYTKFQDGSIEYYTGKGNHPVDTSRILKQLTPYMYKTHIEPLKTQSQN